MFTCYKQVLQKGTSETQQIKHQHKITLGAIPVIEEQEAELQLHTVSISAVTFGQSPQHTKP